MPDASVTAAPQASLPGRIVAHLRRDVPLAALDVVVVLAAYLMPLVLRFDGSVPDVYWAHFRAYLPVIALVHILANYLFGLYGQMWRYASVQEARRVVLAATAAGALIVVANGLIVRPQPLPLSVVILGAGLSLMGFGAIRFESRLFAFRRRSVSEHLTRVLLIGAGDAGSMILNDLIQDPALMLDPVGLLDDDPKKWGLALHGVRVLGGREAIPSAVQRLRADQVLLAIPSATGEVVREVETACEHAGVALRVLPSVRETVKGRVSARDIRDLRIEDLLGRAQVETDLKAVEQLLRGRRVLITGGGGSIGAEIARQVSAFGPDRLVLLDHDETHLHEVMNELVGPTAPEAVLADIRDHDRVLTIFMRHAPEVVFHAAAHKHLPMLETHPEEAVPTNVVGTANLVDAAVATGVERFVLISTDKAVRPTSVMGASKWIAEQIVRSREDEGRVFCAVRFGNVLGSRGSVIPTFLRQIARGGPVTVTDPRMARYFMSLDEAVQLVLQAASLSRGGEIFTLDMGDPVSILELARKLIRLSGHVADKDVKIVITGARPGEKLVEDLIDPEEETLPSTHPSIEVSRPSVPDPMGLRRALHELETLAAEYRQKELKDRLLELPRTSLAPATAGGRG